MSFLTGMFSTPFQIETTDDSMLWRWFGKPGAFSVEDTTRQVPPIWVLKARIRELEAQVAEAESRCKGYGG